MISTVRSALRRLGAGGIDDLRAETGLSADRVRIAVDFLLERGYIRELIPDAQELSRPAAGAGRSSNEARRMVCAHCPIAPSCGAADPSRSRCDVGAGGTGRPVFVLAGA